MSTTPYVLDKTAAEQLLAQVDVHQAMVTLFRELAAGHAVQPARTEALHAVEAGFCDGRFSWHVHNRC